MVKVTPRTPADWTPDEGDVDAWLGQWAAAGWVPEYPWGGVDTTLGGRRGHQVGMIATTPHAEIATVDR